MIMKIVLRQEVAADYKEVAKVIEEAFQLEPYSDHKEHFLVEKLRNSEAFIPELSIVAEIENKIVGHILLTRIRIRNKNESFESLALAPVSVKQNYQKKGIGGQLVRKPHVIAKELGFRSIVLLGHENYYPKFGYVLANKFGIKLPFDAPEENCMVMELVENGLKGVSGVVVYSKEFYE
jgi:predicted N-acetyltransferase YhbS